MKIYCEKCKEVFEAEKPKEGNSVPCRKCKEEVQYPASRTSPGTVIGDFLIENELSRGGMGVVFLARQLSLDRPVALKILQAKFLDDKEYVESFFREARAAARINHPNVVQAYAVGEEDGIFYFAMEYIRGKTMKEILKEEKTIEFRKAAKIIREVAGALECAWRDEKLVHQDIKPDNIMLDANGFAKLADLGLARVAGNNDKESCEGDEVLGTPQYISPEQLTGIPTDVRSDIYSLGATFYQFVTGRFPYVADTAEEIAKLHVAGKLQPPKEVNPELPDELNAIIMKMMARNLEDRYQTPAPLIKALDIYLQHSAPGIGGSVVPQLKFRLPSAGGGGETAAPAPFTAGRKAPFGAPGTSPFPKATPPKPASPKPEIPAAMVKATPPKPVIPPAAPPQPVASSQPVAPPSAMMVKPAVPSGLKPVVPSAPKPEPPPASPVAEPEVKPAEPVKKTMPDEELALKPVAKPETPAPPPPEDGPKGKGKKKEGEKSGAGVGRILLMIFLSLILIAIALGCLGGAFYFLAKGDKLPAALKPYGEKLIAAVHGEKPEGEPGTEAPDSGTAKQVIAPKEAEPPKPVDPTRPEYLAGIDPLLNKIQSNPDDRVGFLEECDRFFLKFPTPLSPKEEEALRPLLNVYHRVDEVARVVPARAAAHAEFQKALDVRRRADEETKQALAAKQEAERQRRERAEAEAQRQAEERARQEAAKKAEAEARLAEIRPKLERQFGKVAASFLASVRTGDAKSFERDLAELRDFPFTPGNSAEEVRLLNQINAFNADLPGEWKKLRAFVERLGQVTPDKDSFSIEMPSHDLLTVVGITPASITAIDGLGKKVPFDLSDPRVKAMFLQRLERRLALAKPAFYLDLMTRDFSAETAKAATQYPFWKTYYKSFLTAYFVNRLSNAPDAEKKALEERCGKLPEFQAAQKEVQK